MAKGHGQEGSTEILWHFLEMVSGVLLFLLLLLLLLLLLFYFNSVRWLHPLMDHVENEST